VELGLSLTESKSLDLIIKSKDLDSLGYYLYVKSIQIYLNYSRRAHLHRL